MTAEASHDDEEEAQTRPCENNDAAAMTAISITSAPTPQRTELEGALCVLLH